VIVDTVVLAPPAGTCKMARSLRPDVATGALTHHWSVREERLYDAVDAVLHKTRRSDEWHELFGPDNGRAAAFSALEMFVAAGPFLNADAIEDELTGANTGW
jgi:hypothetical protein